MTKGFLIFLLILSILSLTTSAAAQATYLNSTDERYIDSYRYIDPQDPRANELEPSIYIDRSDERIYSPLNQINNVKPFQGNITFTSSNDSIQIRPDYLGARIDLTCDVNGFSGSVDWNQLENYPSGCGPGEAVQTIGDTVTCIPVSSTSDTNWSQINAVIPWADVNVVNDLTINSTKDITTTMDINAFAGAGSGATTISGGNFFGNYNPFLSIVSGYFGVDSTHCIVFTNTLNQIVPCSSVLELGSSSNEFANVHSNQFCLDGDCITIWPSDTNCLISGSCPTIAYKNTDVNFEDVNAQTFTAQVPGGLKYVYGTGSKAIESPFPTLCNEIFGVAGFPNTGLEFCASPWTAIAFRLLGTPLFLFAEGGANAGSFYQYPQPGPLTQPPIAGSTTQWATFLDGNHYMGYSNANKGWMEIGTFHSVYSNNYLEQSGDNNGVSAYTMNGEIRFYGSDQNVIIDYNILTDQNRLIFDLNDRNSSFLVSQRNTANQEFNSFMLDGNGNPYFFRVPTIAATLPGLNWDQNTGKIYIRASDSDLKEDVQDNQYDTSWCYDLQPKIWTDKETGYPGVGYLAEDIELLLKSHNIPTWMVPTDLYGNKTIIYEAIHEFCWKAAIEDHHKLVEAQSKIDLITQLVCPLDSTKPECLILNSKNGDPI